MLRNSWYSVYRNIRAFRLWELFKLQKSSKKLSAYLVRSQHDIDLVLRFYSALEINFRDGLVMYFLVCITERRTIPST